jgi:hypothetical protein
MHALISLFLCILFFLFPLSALAEDEMAADKPVSQGAGENRIVGIPEIVETTNPGDVQIEPEPVLMQSENVTVELTTAGPEPRRLVLLPGTTVIWKNVSKNPVQVHFIGKAVSTTCKDPRGFAVGGKGVYSSSPIAPGGIASLCFLEPELYVYEVRPLDQAGRSDDKRHPAGAIQIVRPQ